MARQYAASLKQAERERRRKAAVALQRYFFLFMWIMSVQ